MDIPTKYDPSLTEDKWYKYWIDNKFFESTPDVREAYCIVIPPPNVTGVLHMGHMLNNTIQDVLVRRARMLGKNALWLPGTDHASIATEARVVAKLKEEGINKKDLSREEFLKHAWIWKEKHGGIILEQLKKLGASCDWSRTKFTMDDDMSESVIDVFIDLYKKGYIYRGVRMVNWDPKAKTAVSDEEVNYKEVNSKLFFVKYQIQESSEFITIATTRPETILGDTAVCVNPHDKRYSHLKGKKIIIPLLNRPVPLVFDDYVDMEFGTGALKVTPAHDINDYNLGIKYNLESIDIFNDDGTLNEKAILFVGKDRFVARKEIVKSLENESLITKIEDYTNSIGYSERTDAVIEPKLSIQWFVKMQELTKPALENVMNDNIKLHPTKFKNTYRHWMENVKDWCISRQLWWGQRIPAYYLPNGEFVVADSIENAFILAKEKQSDIKIEQLRQDEDVLDTWFSSWLWPISTFGGIKDPSNANIKYYYPTNDLVTAPEILFFWVARMIIAGYEYMDDKPFNNVYLTGIVRDKLGRKMSKSLGNSPDPIELMKKYGADGVRVGMLLCSPAGNDLPFDENLTEQGRNFGNKIWNAFRLVKVWEIDNNLPQPQENIDAINWFDNRLNQVIELVEDHYSKYRLSDALMEIYKLFWDEFSSWYLEIIKPSYQHPIDSKTLNSTFEFFDKLLKLLHPFMPFITEELWQFIKTRKHGESIMISEMPKLELYNADLLKQFETTKEVISNIRNIRKEKNIPVKENIELYIKSQSNINFKKIISKLSGISAIIETIEKPENSISFRVGTTEFFIPFIANINIKEEIAKLEQELEYNQGFLRTVEAKLNNERFINNAPKNVLENELKKKSDAKTKISAINQQLENMRK